MVALWHGKEVPSYSKPGFLGDLCPPYQSSFPVKLGICRACGTHPYVIVSLHGGLQLPVHTEGAEAAVLIEDDTVTLS